MNIIEVTTNLRGAPHLVAARPRGIAIRMNDGGTLIRVAVKKPYRYVPNANDIVAIDWQMFTREQYGQILKAAAEREAAEEQAKENGDD